MKAIIVDDEPRAIELLSNYLKHFEGIELLATFRNGLKAFEYISSSNVDLIFLDINMPHISGITLSKMLSDKVKVIFTTAYSEYAVESYEIQATDYLLKPISLERFAKAMRLVMSSNEHKMSSQKNTVLIKSGFETYRVETSSILYLMKEGNYMTYFTKDKKIVARETIQTSLDKLPASFVQTHKSYIVNTQQITKYDKNKVVVGDTEIPISDSYREIFLSMVERDK